MNQIKKNTALMGIIQFLSEFKLYSVIAILYFTHVTGSLTLSMSLFSAGMLSAAFFELPTGLISDRVGRKKTLILGSFSALLGVAFYAIGQHYGFLLLGAVLEGVAMAFFSGNNDALLYDLLKSYGKASQYKHYLGKIQSMSHLALSIAGVLGGVILYFSSYAWILWLSVIPKCVSFLLSFSIDEPIGSEHKATSSPFKHLRDVMGETVRNKRLLMQIAADSLSFGAGEASYQFRAAFLKMVWPVWAIGLAGTLGDLGATISFWISGKWIRRAGSKKIILFGKLYSLIVNVVSYLMQNILSPILLTTNSLFYGVISVAQNDMAQSLYSDRYRASMASLKSLIGSLTYAVLALLIGVLADNFGIITALVSFQAFSLIALGFYWVVLRKATRLDAA